MPLILFFFTRFGDWFIRVFLSWLPKSWLGKFRAIIIRSLFEIPYAPVAAVVALFFRKSLIKFIIAGTETTFFFAAFLSTFAIPFALKTGLPLRPIFAISTVVISLKTRFSFKPIAFPPISLAFKTGLPFSPIVFAPTGVWSVIVPLKTGLALKTVILTVAGSIAVETRFITKAVVVAGGIATALAPVKASLIAKAVWSGIPPVITFAIIKPTLVTKSVASTPTLGVWTVAFPAIRRTVEVALPAIIAAFRTWGFTIPAIITTRLIVFLIVVPGAGLPAVAGEGGAAVVAPEVVAFVVKIPPERISLPARS